MGQKSTNNSYFFWRLWRGRISRLGVEPIACKTVLLVTCLFISTTVIVVLTALSCTHPTSYSYNGKLELSNEPIGAHVELDNQVEAAPPVPTPPHLSASFSDSFVRLNEIPTSVPELTGKVTIWWSPDLIPFIEAETLSDVPFTMGLVHTHLRWAQLELLRKLAKGEISTLAGPFTTSIDHLIRTLDLGRAVPEILAQMPLHTRQWLDRFVMGINAYISSAKSEPSEFKLFDLKRERWDAADIILLGRLFAIDINWIRYSQLLELNNERGFAEWWNTILRSQLNGIPSFGSNEAIELLPHFSRTGSNSLVLAGSRTRSHSAIIASDPHVGMVLPALWLAIGTSAPGYHTLGLTIPGIPFVLLGRNEHIAWGGTNMVGLSSALIRVPDEDVGDLRKRVTTIKRRWWLPAKREILESQYGPIVSSLFSSRTTSARPIALNWRGHRPSDEFTAFLKMNVSNNFDEFRQAFSSYAVSGQNFLYGDAEGHIGEIMAFSFNTAFGLASRELVSEPHILENSGELTSNQLPWAYDPEAGFLASANNIPTETDPPVTVGGNWNDRMERLTTSARAGTTWQAIDLGKIQRDVNSPSAKLLALALARRLRRLDSDGLLGQQDSTARQLVTLFEQWDGNYSLDALAPPFLHEMTVRIAHQVYAERFSDRLVDQLLKQPIIFDLLGKEVDEGRADARLIPTVRAIADDIAIGTRWGDIHSLALAHPAGRIPFLGRKYRLGEMQVPGYLTTVLKTAAPLTGFPHTVTYGAAARHITDLGNDDENYMIILGGQDGWWGSSQATNQIPMWASGQLIRVSFDKGNFAKEAKASTKIVPRAIVSR